MESAVVQSEAAGRSIGKRKSDYITSVNIVNRNVSSQSLVSSLLQYSMMYI